MSKKLTYEFVKEQFEKNGYELLSKEYRNNSQKLEYICSKGHKHSINWHDWIGGKRCPYCSGKDKKTIEFIRSEFKKEGYELLSKEYVGAHTKLEYRCLEGHEHSITWDNWNHGHRCPYCSNRIRLTTEFVRSEFKKEGYELLSKEYINAHIKLKYRCSKKHEYNIKWGDWQQGHRCPYCAGNGKESIEFIKSEFEKEGYKLLTTEYVNSKEKLEYICPNGHKHSICWGNWQSGKRCPYCVGKISKGEVEVRNFIKSFGINVSANDRGQIFNPSTGNGFELDIFMPTLNKAVEYNGEYWHQDKNRNLLKQQLCRSKGINLLMVWENEWKTRNDVCKNKIKKFVLNEENV